MGAAAALVVNVAELLREPGRHRHVAVTVDPGDLGAAHPALGGAVDVEADLVSSLDDVVVTGRLDVPWRGACRRCLRPLAATVRVELHDRYAESPDLVERGDASPVVHGQVDLTGLVRDELLLTAAEERLCRPDCAGLCPACGRDRNDGPCGCDLTTHDERWAVLDQLRRPTPPRRPTD